MRKPDHIAEIIWERAGFLRRVDFVVANWLPGVVVALVVSMFFGAMFAGGIMFIFAFVTFDLSWFYGTVARGIFAFFTLLIFFSSMVKA